MKKLLVTKEDERRIEQQRYALIKALQRSKLALDNTFFNELQTKIEHQYTIEREKREAKKEFERRRKIEQKEIMASYLEGFLEGLVGNVYPEIWENPLYKEYRIFEPVAKWIVDTFTCNYPTREEYEEQYYTTIYEKVYHHIYDELITLPKRRERRLKGVKNRIWQEVKQNADENAT